MEEVKWMDIVNKYSLSTTHKNDLPRYQKYSEMFSRGELPEQQESIDRYLEGLILSYCVKLHGLYRQDFEKHFNITTNRYGGE